MSWRPPQNTRIFETGQVWAIPFPEYRIRDRVIVSDTGKVGTVRRQEAALCPTCVKPHNVYAIHYDDTPLGDIMTHEEKELERL